MKLFYSQLSEPLINKESSTIRGAISDIAFCEIKRDLRASFLLVFGMLFLEELSHLSLIVLRVCLCGEMNAVESLSHWVHIINNAWREVGDC